MKRKRNNLDYTEEEQGSENQPFKKVKASDSGDNNESVMVSSNPSEELGLEEVSKSTSENILKVHQSEEVTCSSISSELKAEKPEISKVESEVLDSKSNPGEWNAESTAEVAESTAEVEESTAEVAKSTAKVLETVSAIEEERTSEVSSKINSVVEDKNLTLDCPSGESNLSAPRIPDLNWPSGLYDNIEPPSADAGSGLYSGLSMPHNPTTGMEKEPKSNVLDNLGHEQNPFYDYKKQYIERKRDAFGDSSEVLPARSNDYGESWAKPSEQSSHRWSKPDPTSYYEEYQDEDHDPELCVITGYPQPANWTNVFQDVKPELIEKMHENLEDDYRDGLLIDAAALRNRLLQLNPVLEISEMHAQIWLDWKQKRYYKAMEEKGYGDEERSFRSESSSQSDVHISDHGPAKDWFPDICEIGEELLIEAAQKLRQKRRWERSHKKNAMEMETNESDTLGEAEGDTSRKLLNEPELRVTEDSEPKLQTENIEQNEEVCKDKEKVNNQVGDLRLTEGTTTPPEVVSNDVKTSITPTSVMSESATISKVEVTDDAHENEVMEAAKEVGVASQEEQKNLSEKESQSVTVEHEAVVSERNEGVAEPVSQQLSESVSVDTEKMQVDAKDPDPNLSKPNAITNRTDDLCAEGPKFPPPILTDSTKAAEKSPQSSPRHTNDITDSKDSKDVITKDIADPRDVEDTISAPESMKSNSGAESKDAMDLDHDGHDHISEEDEQENTSGEIPVDLTDHLEFVVYPEPGAPKAVPITIADLGRLRPDTYLNDNICDFFLKYLAKDILTPEKSEKVHIFSSFFYKKLFSLAECEREKGMRRWGRKIDLFDKDYVVIPINQNLHWSLAIVIAPGFDPKESVLKKYLDDKENAKKAKLEEARQKMLDLLKENRHKLGSSQALEVREDVTMDIDIPPPPNFSSEDFRADENLMDTEEILGNAVESRWPYLLPPKPAWDPSGSPLGEGEVNKGAAEEVEKQGEMEHSTTNASTSVIAGITEETEQLPEKSTEKLEISISNQLAKIGNLQAADSANDELTVVKSKVDEAEGASERTTSTELEAGTISIPKLSEQNSLGLELDAPSNIESCDIEISDEKSKQFEEVVSPNSSEVTPTPKVCFNFSGSKNLLKNDQAVKNAKGTLKFLQGTGKPRTPKGPPKPISEFTDGEEVSKVDHSGQIPLNLPTPYTGTGLVVPSSCSITDAPPSTDEKSESPKLPDHLIPDNPLILFKLLELVKDNKPKIIHLDSMRGCHNSDLIYSDIRQYLAHEWKRRKGTERNFCKKWMPGVSLGVPQQENGCDCGVFMIHQAEKFLLNPLVDIGLSNDRRNWFPSSEIKRKREDIKQILISLREKQGLPKINILRCLEILGVRKEDQGGIPEFSPPPKRPRSPVYDYSRDNRQSKRRKHNSHRYDERLMDYGQHEEDSYFDEKAYQTWMSIRDRNTYQAFVDYLSRDYGVDLRPRLHEFSEFVSLRHQQRGYDQYCSYPSDSGRPRISSYSDQPMYSSNQSHNNYGTAYESHRTSDQQHKSSDVGDDDQYDQYQAYSEEDNIYNREYDVEHSKDSYREEDEEEDRAESDSVTGSQSTPLEEGVSPSTLDACESKTEDSLSRGDTQKWSNEMKMDPEATDSHSVSEKEDIPTEKEEFPEQIETFASRDQQPECNISASAEQPVCNISASAEQPECSTINIVEHTDFLSDVKQVVEKVETHSEPVDNPGDPEELVPIEEADPKELVSTGSNDKPIETPKEEIPDTDLL